MNTPICDFVENYVNRNAVRAHMPGHKGRGALGFGARDITEIPGAGVLYQPCNSEERSDEESLSANEEEILCCAQNDRLGRLDIISESEKSASALFGTAKTLYSTEGSSLCIRAMLYLARLHATASGKKPRILAGRNAHKVFLTAAALLDIEIEWLWPEDGSLLSCRITPEALSAGLAELQEPATAVYITSPDYLGNAADIAALAQICHAHDSLLLVDNAHGAYLNFLPENRHPMALGADICCDSAHKTLPVLTGGAYLHLAKSCPAAVLDAAEQAMQLFASTSPSYLVLQSLDAVNPYLAGDYRSALAAFCAETALLKQRLRQNGYLLRGDEPLKICIDAKACGYHGTELSTLLDRAGIVCEFADPDVTVLMLTPENSTEGLHKIESILCAIPRRKPITDQAPMLPKPEQVISPREALFSLTDLLPVASCEGRILAQPSVMCPPAVPIAVCGERLSKAHLDLFRYYGVTRLRVVSTE